MYRGDGRLRVRQDHPPQGAAGLDRPTSGTVRLAGQDLGALRESQVTRLRRDRDLAAAAAG